MADKNISILVRATDKVSKVMDGIQKRVDRFTLKSTRLQFQALSRAALLPTIGNRFSTMATQAGLLGTQVRMVTTRLGLLAGVAGGGLFALTKSFTDAGDAAAKTADKLSLPVETLQSWRFAAERANVPAEAFDQSLQSLSKRMGEFAVTGAGKGAPAFEALGLSADILEGRLKTLDGVFPLILDRLNKIPNAQIRNAVAAKLFGDEGIKLVNLASEGSQGLLVLEKRARALGLVISEKTARNTEVFADQLTDLGFAISGVRNQLGEQLLPVFSEFTVKLTNFLINNKTDIARWAQRIGKEVAKLPAFLKNLNQEFTRLRETLAPVTAALAKVVQHFGLLNSVVAAFAVFTLGPLVLTLGKLSLSVISLLGGLGRFALLIGRLLPAGFAVLIPLVSRLSLVLAPLVALIATAAAPFLILAAKVALVVGALYGLHVAARKLGEMLSNWEPFQSLINNIYVLLTTTEPIKKFFQSIQDHVAGFVSSLGRGLDMLRELGRFNLRSLGEGIGNKFKDITGLAPADQRAGKLQKQLASSQRPQDSSAKVTLDFKNLPRGTRLSSDSKGPVDLFLNPGFSLP